MASRRKCWSSPLEAGQSWRIILAVSLLVVVCGSTSAVRA